MKHPATPCPARLAGASLPDSTSKTARSTLPATPGGIVSVEKITAELNQALVRLDLAPLRQAMDLLDQAARTVAHAAQGTNRPEAAQALGFLDQTRQQLGQIHQTVTAAKALVEQYIANLAGGETTAPTANTPPATSPLASKPVRTNATSDKQTHVDAILATLPPPVPKPNPSGKKTHGRIVGSDEQVASAEDAESDEVWQRLVAAGVPEKFKPMSIDHAEMKVALRMVKSGTKHVELVINNVPCRGPWSCRTLLGLLLPEGYTLTVYGPNNYQGTFSGGKKWSS
jgi:hypothetical protein